MILEWITRHSGAIISTVTASVVVGGAFVVIEGYEGTREAEKKIGIALHDQGHMLVELNDGKYKHRDDVSNELFGKEFDLAENPREWAEWIGGVGFTRFGASYGCSYTVICTPDSSYWMKRVGGIGAHASGFNSPLVGVMMTRTDSDSLNKLTLWQTRLVISALQDSIFDLFGEAIQVLVFHSDIATNGKQDPHEFRPMIDKLGLRWDDRQRNKRIKGVPTLEKAQKKWNKTTRDLMQ